MAKMYKVVIQDTAAEDLDSIWEYIADERNAPKAASKLLRELEMAIMSLAHLPERHELIREKLLREKNIRYIPVENYLVFYVVNDMDGVVSIIRVLYGKSNWQHLL